MYSLPNFSVSMCVYGGDCPVDFDIAINSIVNQTAQPNEIVLTVDGPIPDSIENVIHKYRKYLSKTLIDFKVVYLENNMGHGEARRVCLNNCSYELVALMDADDISAYQRFEKQLEYFSTNPGISVVGGYIHEFIESPENIVGRRTVPETDKEIKHFMKKRCPMNQVTVMFKKSDIEAVGGYIDWYCEEDYYLWIRLALAGNSFGNIPEKLVDVRVGKEMYRRRGGLKYFKSEVRLQCYMLTNRVIGIPRFFANVIERLILQVLMPNTIRGYLFRKFARE